MPRDTHWRNLLPGVLCVAALAALALSVLVFARVGALHGDVMRLYLPTGGARGVLEGTEVWLEGKKVGRVIDIAFAPVSVDTARRLVIVMDVLDEVRPLIRRDSYAQVRTGSSLIGAPVVFITVGSPASPVIASGDTLSPRPQNDAESLSGTFARASQDFPAIIGSVQLLNSQLTMAKGTIGAALAPDNEGVRQLSRFGARTGSLYSKLSTGRGTVPRILGGGLQPRVARLLSGVDSLQRAFATPGSSLGRFRGDSTLLVTARAVLAQTDSIRALLAEPRGTAGRAMQDEVLAQEVARARTEVEAVIRDLKANPLRYRPF